jgi:carboxyl-terminal processing protease
MLGGPAGSSVRVTVMRDGVSTPLELVVDRTDAGLPPLSVTRPAADVAMLRVLSFRDSTLEEAAEQLERQWRARPFKGLIVDLRGSPGGQLATVIGLAAMFLEPGHVVGTSKGQDPDASFTFGADPLVTYVKSGSSRALAALSAPIRTVPMVVLVDEATSAGAEFVTAAWQDHRRAVVIGRPTLGQGSIQTIKMVPGGGAIRYTSAHWIAPSGRRFEESGIVPERIVAEADEPNIVDLAIKVLSSGR